MSIEFVGDLHTIDSSSPFYALTQEEELVRIKKWNSSDVAQCVRNKTIQNACDTIALLFVIASICICALDLLNGPDGYMIFGTVLSFIGASCVFYKATSSLPTLLKDFPCSERTYTVPQLTRDTTFTVSELSVLSQDQLAKLYQL